MFFLLLVHITIKESSLELAAGGLGLDLVVGGLYTSLTQTTHTSLYRPATFSTERTNLIMLLNGLRLTTSN